MHEVLINKGNVMECNVERQTKMCCGHRLEQDHSHSDGLIIQF